MDMGVRSSTADLVVDDSVETKKPSKKCVLISLVIGVSAISVLVILVITVVVVTHKQTPCLSGDCVKPVEPVTSKYNPCLTGDCVKTTVEPVTSRHTPCLTGDCVKATVEPVTPRDNVCMTEECQRLAATYKSAMDSYHHSPCANFYEYACGGWIKSHAVPADGSSYDHFSVLMDDLNVKLKDLILRDRQTEEPSSYEEVRNYYKSCVDKISINSFGIKPLTDLLDAVGGWPVLGNNPGGNWHSLNYDFETLWSTLKGQYGVDGVIAVDILNDDKHSANKIIKIDQAGFSVAAIKTKDAKKRIPVFPLVSEEQFPKNYAQKMLFSDDYPEVRQAYLQYMVDIVVALGGIRTTAVLQMTKVLDFETEVEKFKVFDDDLEEMYNPTTIGELGKAYPTINWLRFFELLFPASVTPPVTSVERVINVAPAYLERLTRWLPYQDTVVITNYMIWKLVDAMVPYLGDTFDDIQQQMLRSWQVATDATPRWKQCVTWTNENFPYVVGRMYVDGYFSESTKEMVFSMVTEIQNAFKSMIWNNDWLESVDKTKAIEKIDEMTVLVGYPDYIKDNPTLDVMFGNRNITENDFFLNNLKVLKLSIQSSLESYRSTIPKNTWLTGPATVNAFYAPELNNIQIPAAILQPPFFNHRNPQFYNFGGIGTAIGHELTHGFDDNGRKFDKNGNLRAWWTSYSIIQFEDRTTCLEEQYSNFFMPANHQYVDGQYTLGENIADVGGLKEAYKAWQAHKEGVPSQPLLPGLDFTEDQMFFLTYAQLWCNVIGEEGADLALIDSHSPGRFRVIGGLKNNEDFSKAFNCRKGSYMNPHTKCNVW